MPTTCLNCGATVYENFCPRCGQKADVKKLTWHNFIEEIFHFFTHIEKGFLRTTKQLIFHPGKLCKEYLDGKRKSYHKPISFLLIWVTIYLLVLYLADQIMHFEIITTNTLVTWDPYVFEIIKKYRTLIDLLIAPLMAFILWVIVARPKLNYVEVLSIYFYLYSFSYIVNITNIIIDTCLGISIITNTNQFITRGVIAVWGLFAGYDLYKRYSVLLLIPRLILFIIVNLVVYFFVGGMIARVLVALGV